jgi:hypothetical protein
MAWTVVSGVVALIVATLGARSVGRLLKTRPAAWYFTASALVFVVAVALFVVASLAWPAGVPAAGALGGVALGLGFGGMAGLRYGYKGMFELGTGKARS